MTAPIRLTDEREGDGPECETCGRTACPDANLPSFSEPKDCEFAPLYRAFRDTKDCDYGCGRDFTNQGIRLEVAPAVGRIAQARVEAAERALVERVEAVIGGWDRGLDVDEAHEMDPTRRLIRDLRAALAPSSTENREG